MSSSSPALPIFAIEGAFMAASASGPVVVSAPTGSGKSTVVPRWCAREGRRVLVVEPRRVACRSLARFVAGELREKVGEVVGYAVRHDERIGPRTRIAFVTPGVALRMLSSGARDRYDAFVVDELHERSLEVDLVLALLAEEAGAGLVVMSATLDGDRVAAFLGGRHLRAEGRAFPVGLTYTKEPLLPSVQGLEGRVDRAVQEALHHDGDVLVFLPGKGEIASCAAALARRPEIEVLRLHGALPPEEQDKAFAPGRRRRVILATNVAETSVTLPRIGVVIDSGLVRQRRPRGERSHLTLVPIALDAAEQRRGRAGRLFAGHCLRLWSASAVLEQTTRPAMLREPLSATVLAAAACNRQVATLRLLDPPPREAVARAEEALRSMGALDAEAGLTAAGRELSRFPLDPFLGRLLLSARESPALQDVLDLVAAVAAGRPLFAPGPRPEDPDDDLRAEGCDGLALIRAMREGQVARHHLNAAPLREARRGAAQLRRMLGLRAPSAKRIDRQALLAALLAAHPQSAYIPRRRGRTLAWANGRGRELSLGRESAAPEDAAALVVVDTRALMIKRRAVEMITCALPARPSDLRRADLGELKVTAAKVKGGRILAETVLSHAGLVLKREACVPEGDAARQALHTLLARGSVFAEVIEQTRETLQTHRLLARLKPEYPGALELDDWLRERIETLGVESGEDLCLLSAEDFACEPVPEDEAVWLERHFPQKLFLGDAHYRVEYEPRGRQVTIVKIAGTRKTPPDLSLLPRWRGWKVQHRDRNALRVLRG